jgi:DNA-directed RNA polymerase II subunit RPB2
MLIELLTGKMMSTDSPLHKIDVKEAYPKDEEDEMDEDGFIGNYRVDENTYKFKKSYLHPDHSDCVDGTPFRNNVDLSIVHAELQKVGLDGYGDTIMYCPITGRQMKAMIMFGPVYYQRLKHMVVDKVHARARGGKTTLTRQPKEGRQFGGGLRIGVQERDCILGQGGSAFIKDRMVENSDEFRTWVCDLCGLIALVDKTGACKECKICEGNKVSQIKISYGTKLITQELSAMNIIPRILTQPFEKPE